MAEIVERYSTPIDIYSHRRVNPKLSTYYACFKIILLVSNLVFMVKQQDETLIIFGCALIGVGSYALNSSANNLVGQTLPSGLIAMGVFVLFLSAIGAISAWRESIYGLAFYLAFLLIITIILFSIGVAVVVKKNQASTYISQAWTQAPDDVKRTIQNNLGCCGLNSTIDQPFLPCPTTPIGANTTNCLDKLVSGFNSAYSHAGATGIAFSLIMGLAIILVVCLLQGIKRKQNEAQQEKVRIANQVGMGLAENTGDIAVDLDSIDAGAASMFDKHGYHPEEHNPQQAQQSNQQRRKR